MGDPLPDSLPSVARTRVRVNGTLIGAREAIHFHTAGAAAGTATDDPINEEIDITITGPTSTTVLFNQVFS